MKHKTIGIIGPGKLGIVLAQLATRAQYPVLISGSTNDKHLSLTLSSLAPEAIATTREKLVQAADIIILAIPLSKYKTIRPNEFDGKLVIDAMNYWWEVDGDKDSLLNPHSSSSEQVQAYFENARVIKALSHVGYHDLYDNANQESRNNRRAIAVAGGNLDDQQLVAMFIDDLGFDPILIGKLAAGKVLEPGSPSFGASLSKDELVMILPKSATQ